MKYWLILLALVAPSLAMAADPVSLTSEVFVERVQEDAEGKRTTVLEPPSVVTPGDKLLFVLSYVNGGADPAEDFVVTNAIPEAVEGDHALVSVDGGKTWGSLPALKVNRADGTTRAAGPADVTHIRWRFSQPIPAGEGGKLSFRGVVK